MKAYKGFNKDMTCRGFQYEEGKTYETDEAVLCESGFHACEMPLDVFTYYPPATSEYHEVELDKVADERNSEDTKVCAKKIKIGAKINIANIVSAQIEYISKKVTQEQTATGDKGASSATGDYGASSATGDYGASSATGDYGASSATGYKGASSATGYKGASSATGNCGASSATGNCGASSATGNYGASSATGDYGASSATGDYGASSATGYYGASSATGDYGASSATGYKGASSATGNCGASSATGYKGASSANDPYAIAVAWGYYGKAKGVLGSHLVLAEWEGDENKYWAPDKWKFKGAKMVQVDGEKIKADTWYTLKNGEFVEVEDEN